MGVITKLILMITIITVVAACSANGPSLTYQLREYSGPELVPPPNGEPEGTRYGKAYGAFWWNCVFVKLKSLEARCPSFCSGTPGASYGCAEGAMDAANQIDEIRAQFEADRIEEYLVKLTKTSDAIEMIRPYFGGTPRELQISE